MGHRFETEPRLYLNENDHLIFETIAVYKGNRLDISRFDLDSEKTYYRFGNLKFVFGGGWCIEYPNEVYRYRYYGGKYTAKKERYEESDKEFSGLFNYSLMNSDYANYIISNKPEFKYLINKLDLINYPLTILTTFKLMIMWRKHPLEVECLSQKGLYNIALNNNLYKLSPTKKKALIKGLNGINDNDITLQDIQTILKNKITFEEYKEMKEINSRLSSKKLTWKEILYCKKKDYPYSNYRDMLDLVELAGHSLKDEYWHYPSNPHEIHQRLAAQRTELERIKKSANLSSKNKAVLETLKLIADKNKMEEVDLGKGFKLFMPTTFEQYLKTAEVLYQCVVSNKYYEKVAQGKSLLFMIWKDNEPSSTAEITYKKEILQFYGNERDRNNCKPTKFEEKAFNNFLLTFKPKRIKNYLAG